MLINKRPNTEPCGILIFIDVVVDNLETTWKHKVSTSWDLTWNTSRFGHGPSSI